MEIKTQVEILNEIANKLGDTSPDEMITESQALQNILDHMDGGGGGASDMFFVVEIHCNEDDSIECEYKSWSDLTQAINENGNKILVLKVSYSNGDAPEYHFAELKNVGLYYSNTNYRNDEQDNYFCSVVEYGYHFPFNPADSITYNGFGYSWSVTTFDPFD